MKASVWIGAISCALICSHQGAAGFFLGSILGAVAGLLTFAAWKVFEKLLAPLLVGIGMILVIMAVVASSAKP